MQPTICGSNRNSDGEGGWPARGGGARLPCTLVSLTGTGNGRRLAWKPRLQAIRTAQIDVRNDTHRHSRSEKRVTRSQSPVWFGTVGFIAPTYCHASLLYNDRRPCGTIVPTYWVRRNGLYMRNGIVSREREKTSLPQQRGRSRDC